MCEFRKIKNNSCWNLFITLDEKKCNKKVYDKIESHLCCKHSEEIIKICDQIKETKKYPSNFEQIKLQYSFQDIIDLQNYRYRYYDFLRRSQTSGNIPDNQY
jgi:hypothetical protein